MKKLFLLIIICLYQTTCKSEEPFKINCHAQGDIFYVCFPAVAWKYLTTAQRDSVKKRYTYYLNKTNSEVYARVATNDEVTAFGLCNCNSGKADKKYLQNFNDDPFSDNLKTIVEEYCSRVKFNSKGLYEHKTYRESFIWLDKEFFCAFVRELAINSHYDLINKEGAQRFENKLLMLCDELSSQKISTYEAYFQLHQEYDYYLRSSKIEEGNFILKTIEDIVNIFK